VKRLFVTLRVASVAISALIAAGLVWRALRRAAEAADAGRLIAVIPEIVVLALVLSAVVTLAHAGVAASTEGQPSARATRAAKRGATLAALLAGVGTGTGVGNMANGLVAVVPIGLAVAALIVLAFLFRRASAVLTPPPSLPAPGTVTTEPVDVELAAASQPYPYPSPLPAAAKSAHITAITKHSSRGLRWTALGVPGLLMVTASLVWGRGRHGSAATSLWNTHPHVAAWLLAGGVLLLAITVPVVARVSKIVDQHQRLLKAYGITVSTRGVEMPTRQGPR